MITPEMMQLAELIESDYSEIIKKNPDYVTKYFLLTENTKYPYLRKCNYSGVYDPKYINNSFIFVIDNQFNLLLLFEGELICFEKKDNIREQLILFFVMVEKDIEKQINNMVSKVMEEERLENIRSKIKSILAIHNA